MPLTWDASKLEDLSKVCDTDADGVHHWFPWFEGLIWWGTAYGSEITEKNWRMVYERMRIVEEVFGPLEYKVDASGEKSPNWITPEKIHDCIGLRTNWGTPPSETKFRTRIMEELKRRAADKLSEWDAKQRVKGGA